MNALKKTALVLTVACALPTAVFAQSRPQSRPPQAQPQRQAPQAPQPQRNVQQQQPQMQQRPVQPSRPQQTEGFNLRRDITARPVQAPVVRQQTQAQFQGRAIPPNYHRITYAPVAGGPYHGRFQGPIVRAPHQFSQPWQWNRGVVWYPAPIYWGGGFWGDFALASLGDAYYYGAYVDDQTQSAYPSYQIQPESPGAQVLQNYQLQQTPCGPPNLVVMWGPDESVICATPNDIVGPGNYQIDPATFNLISLAPQ